MLTHEETALRRISERLHRVYPDEIVAVYAFGSRVRGDHDAWSDFDVLVVVKGRNTKMERGIIDIFVEEESSAGLSFTPVIKDLSAFEMEKRYHSPFYESLITEGVLL